MTMRIMIAALAVAALSATSLQAEDGKPGQAGVFKRLDANGDGKLRADEVPADKRAFFDRALRSGDADGDGALNAAEFARAFSAGKDSARERECLAGEGRWNRMGRTAAAVRIGLHGGG